MYSVTLCPGKRLTSDGIHCSVYYYLVYTSEIFEEPKCLYGNIYYRMLCSTEKAMAPHSCTLAWKIPWMEESGGLQSIGLLRDSHD